MPPIKPASRKAAKTALASTPLAGQTNPVRPGRVTAALNPIAFAKGGYQRECRLHLIARLSGYTLVRPAQL